MLCLYIVLGYLIELLQVNVFRMAFQPVGHAGLNGSISFTGRNYGRIGAKCFKSGDSMRSLRCTHDQPFKAVEAVDILIFHQ